MVTWCFDLSGGDVNGHRMAWTKKSAPCREMGLVVTQQNQSFLSIQPEAKWTDKFWVTAVGNPPYPYSGWTLHGLGMWSCSRTRFRVEDCWRKMTASPSEPVVEWCAGGLLHLSGTPCNRKTFTSGKKKKVAVECKQSYYLNTMSCQENQGSVTTTLLIYIPINMQAAKLGKKA